MPKYNVFDESIDADVKEKHDALMAQSQLLFDASNIISDAMLDSGMNQQDLSGYLGVSKGYISRLLSGTENISLKNIAKILHKLDHKLSLKVEKINNDSGNNIVWVDFSNSNQIKDVHFEYTSSSTAENWSNETIVQACM